MNSLATLGCVTALTLSSFSAHAMCTPEDARAKAAELAAKVQQVGENDPQRAARINAELEDMKVKRSAEDVPDECAMYDQRLREFEAADKKGSSRITGEVILDLHKEEFAVPVAVCHPFDDLDSVVNPF